jgi:hypothetical protein
MLKNMDLRKILRPKRDELTGFWKRLHDVYFYLPFLKNINGMIESIKIGCEGNFHIW